VGGWVVGGRSVGRLLNGRWVVLIRLRFERRKDSQPTECVNAAGPSVVLVFTFMSFAKHSFNPPFHPPLCFLLFFLLTRRQRFVFAFCMCGRANRWASGWVDLALGEEREHGSLCCSLFAAHAPSKKRTIVNGLSNSNCNVFNLKDNLKFKQSKI